MKNMKLTANRSIKTALEDHKASRERRSFLEVHKHVFSGNTKKRLSKTSISLLGALEKTFSFWDNKEDDIYQEFYEKLWNKKSKTR